MSISEDRRLSYSSANVPYPLKVVRHFDLVSQCVLFKKIFPIHLQLTLTNACNFNCSFCSCGNRDKAQQLTRDEILYAVSVFKDVGGKSVTITGGGEPMIHPDYVDLVRKIKREFKIDVGTVTNGSQLKRVEKCLKDHTWIRVSSSNELPRQVNQDAWIDQIRDAVKTNKRVDWAFSHVVTPTNFEGLNYLNRLISFANKYRFTHVRLVNDILNADALRFEMDKIRAYLQLNAVDLSRVIFQDRATYTRGFNPCYISLLKPVVGADGYLYPCCGVQYALEDPGLDFEVSMRMGRIQDLPRLVKNQEFYDGSRCVKCYYEGYNKLLRFLLEGLEHENFV